MIYDDIEKSKEDRAQIDIERQKEIDEHAKYLADKTGIGEFESMAISCIGSRMESFPTELLGRCLREILTLRTGLHLSAMNFVDGALKTARRQLNQVGKV